MAALVNALCWYVQNKKPLNVPKVPVMSRGVGIPTNRSNNCKLRTACSEMIETSQVSLSS